MHRTNFICYVCVIDGASSFSSKRRCSRRTLLPSTLKEMFKQRPGSGDTQFFLIVLLSIRTGDNPDRVPASGSAPVHRDLHSNSKFTGAEDERKSSVTAPPAGVDLPLLV